MEEKFTICLVHNKSDLLDIIKTGTISITLEPKEIQELQDALRYGTRTDAVFIKQPEVDVNKNKVLDALDGLQDLLDSIRSEVEDQD